MDNRLKEYYILKYGDKYIKEVRFSGGYKRDIMNFSLADREKDAEIFWKDSSYDMLCLKKLVSSDIGIAKVNRAKYIAEVVL